MGRPTYSNWPVKGVGHSICGGVTIDVARRCIRATVGEYFRFNESFA